MMDQNLPRSGLAAFGVPGLDDVLGGGLAPHRLYLLEGAPGSVTEVEPLRGLLRDFVERECDGGITSNKTSVEIGEAEERLDVSDRSRDGPMRDSVQLLRVHLDSVGAKEVSEVLEFGLIELALLDVCKELCGSTEKL